MEWKFKQSVLEAESGPDGFIGPEYHTLEEILEDPAQIKAIKDAENLLRSFEIELDCNNINLCPQQDYYI